MGLGHPRYGVYRRHWRGMNELKTSTQGAASATVQSFVGQPFVRGLRAFAYRKSEARSRGSPRQLGAEARSTGGYVHFDCGVDSSQAAPVRFYRHTDPVHTQRSFSPA